MAGNGLKWLEMTGDANGNNNDYDNDSDNEIYVDGDNGSMNIMKNLLDLY